MRLLPTVFRALLYVLTPLHLSAAAAADPETTVTNLDMAAIRTAIQSGGTVRLAFDGIVPLSEPFVIQRNVTIDGTGRRITFDGGGAVRHFVVTNGASLTLQNLQLVHGRFIGANGPADRPGDPAQEGPSTPSAVSLNSPAALSWVMPSSAGRVALLFQHSH